MLVVYHIIYYTYIFIIIICFYIPWKVSYHGVHILKYYIISYLLFLFFCFLNTIYSFLYISNKKKDIHAFFSQILKKKLVNRKYTPEKNLVGKLKYWWQKVLVFWEFVFSYQKFRKWVNWGMYVHIISTTTWNLCFN